MRKTINLLLMICLIVLLNSCNGKNFTSNNESTNKNGDINDQDSLDINWEEIIITKDKYLVLDELYEKNSELMSYYLQFTYGIGIDKVFFINEKDKEKYENLKKENGNIDYVNSLCLNIGNNWIMLALECYNYEDAVKFEKLLNQRMPGKWIKHKNIILNLTGALIILLEGDSIMKSNATLSKNGKIFIMNHNQLYNSSFLKIPNDILYLSDIACKHNEFLKQLFCNDSLIRIGEFAFYNCLNLKNVKLNDKLKQIDDRAFYGCPITNIVVPISVKTMGVEVFTSGNIFCETKEKPEGWNDDFYTGTAKIYWKDQWDYDGNGKPYVLPVNI